MSRMTLRKMSEMNKKQKRPAFDYSEVLANYHTAYDLSLLDRIVDDLDIRPYADAHKKVYCLDHECKHPAYIYDLTLALNVFEGCCFNDLSLKEKRLAVVAALFRQTRKNIVLEKVYAELQKLDGTVDLTETEFISAAIALNAKKARPGKTDTVMRMVLWDAKNMHLYNPNFDSFGYLCDLFSDKELTEPSISYQTTLLINAQHCTNWARLKAHKLNWPEVIKRIFLSMPRVKNVLMSNRKIW